MGLFSLSQVNLCEASALLLQSLLLSLSELKNFRYADKTFTQGLPRTSGPLQLSPTPTLPVLPNPALKGALCPHPMGWDHT